jgi:hypothetical protein
MFQRKPQLLFGRMSRRVILFTLAACAVGRVTAAPLPSEWRNFYTSQVPRSGLIKISVPLEVLSSARSGLEDLRLFDSSDHEVPYLLEPSTPTPPGVRPPKQFQVTVTANATVATLETGLTEPITSITMQTPATDFLKAVQIEGSQDRRKWEVLAQGQPVFRQRNGASQLHLAISPARWAFLRVMLDDRRSSPIPLTGALVHSAASTHAGEESLGVAIVQRSEEPGVTRLMLRLDGANCTLASLRVETPELLFTRAVALAQPQFVEGEVRESVIHGDSIFRVMLPDQPAVAKLRLAPDVPLRSRDLALLITNDDNPPLQITALSATRRPVHVTFNAAEAGRFKLLTGNPFCAGPRYDLEPLKASLQSALVVSVSVESVGTSESRSPASLADLPTLGPALDVAEWAFRKPLSIVGEGVQQVELDLEVLAHATPGLRDLRVMRDGRQVPFVLQHTPMQRSFSPPVARADDPKRPSMSRWQITLPLPGAPVSELTFATPAPFFKRDARLVEERRDERGVASSHTLGSAAWMRGPGEKQTPLTLSLMTRPESDTLFLEVENGDNPPLDLQGVQAWHPVSRLLFKSAPAPGIWLYYGNAYASRPQYDLELAVPKLLAAEKNEVKPGPEEVLKPGAVRRLSSGQAGWIFWSALGLVVAGLLFILARLLPKAPAEAS